MNRYSSLFLTLLALLVLPAGTARANMANPVHPGDPVGEPSGELAHLYIERETLTLDLRALTQGEKGAAIVEATYRVRNAGARRAINLVFVANALAPDKKTSSAVGGVWLDGKPVPFSQRNPDQLPGDWEAPPTTPPLDGSKALDYETESVGTLGFRLTLAPGPHTIRVRYAAVPTTYSGDSPTVYRQLGYVLAPARRWAGFGGLDVAVQVPPGWRAASSPALARRGDMLSGSFDTLPADALALTVQAPPPFAPPYGLLVCIGGLLVCIGLGALAGRGLGRRGWSSGWAIPLSLLSGLGWGIAVFLVAGVAEPSALKERAGSQAAWTYG